MPKQINLTPAFQADLERFAREDGVQRGVFIDTSGNVRTERVSKTACHGWLFKTTNGQPFEWGKEYAP